MSSSATEAPGTAGAGGSAREIDLEIGGMTCSSCAARIENKLNRMDGVTATVNYATENAHVRVQGQVTPQDLLATVVKTGYTARLPEPAVVRAATPAARTDSADGAAPTDGADGADDRRAADLRQRLMVSAGLATPVVLMAMIPALQFDNWQWLSLTLASPVVVWGAWPFHRAAWINLRHGATTMDTLVSLGVAAAYLWSLYALFLTPSGTTGWHLQMSWPWSSRPTGMSATATGADIYLEIASAVTVFLLAGRYAEARAKRRSGAALRALLDLGAKEVSRVVRRPDGTTVEERVDVALLAVGEEFVVRPGEKVATDAVVVEGASAIDESLLTGESVPVEVGPGDAVTGATLNTSGRLRLRATRVGADTRLAQIGRLVTRAQAGKAPVQRLADRVSAVFVPVVIALSLLTLLGWLLVTGDVESAFTAAVAVLIIACPCALGLATPTALLVGTGRGAQLGVLIKGPEILEQTRKADTILLDKTGTVTEGRMRLVGVVAADGEDRDVVLRLAAAVEAASEHPVARAIADGATAKAGAAGGLPPAVESFSSTQGLGVEGVVADAATGTRHAVLVGRPAWLEQRAIHLTPALATAMSTAQDAGRTAVAVGWDGRARGVLVVADTVRPTSAAAIAALRDLGLRPVLLTGDNARAAGAVAAEVGISPADVVAEVLPEDKVAQVRRFQDAGRQVAMVGDGVNDAAALAQADLGLAMGSGTDVAIEASDLTLVRSDLFAAVDAIRLSRRTLATIKGNLFWAFAYNVAAIPLAALGLLSPLVAGAAMAFSSVFVVTNSLRLRGFQPSGAAAAIDPPDR